ncbi:MAG: hypothetical protein NT069_11375, partial [Planctomycetota bacterium]|nr:hypothetical protein [Planctomycetota bacterium]
MDDIHVQNSDSHDSAAPNRRRLGRGLNSLLGSIDASGGDDSMLSSAGAAPAGGSNEYVLIST